MPLIKEMLEETMKTDHLTTVEESVRKQMREWAEKEDYFDKFFTKIIRNKNDKATYGPQLLTWEMFSDLYQIVSWYHLNNLKQTSFL